MDTDTNTKKREHGVYKRFDFVDAPPVAHPGKKTSGKQLSKWNAVASRMRKIDEKNYGRWAKVAFDVHFTLGARLKKRFPDIDWKIRKDEHGKHNLWASYPASNSQET